MNSKRQDQPNFRFWAWVNGGWVKLSLLPREALSHREGGPCEEGYDVTWTTWEHEGTGVFRSTFRDARDCDGRITREYDDFADAGSLAAVRADDGTMRPDWHELECQSRDYAAEAMGY